MGTRASILAALRRRRGRSTAESDLERFHDALRFASAALWELDAETREMTIFGTEGEDTLFGHPLAVWQDPELRRALRHPEDVSIGPDAVERLLRGEAERVEYETRITDGAGGWRVLQHTATIVGGAARRTVRGFSVEVTVERLRQDLYRALLDSTAVGVAIVTRDRRVLDCNDALCRILGVRKAELAGLAAEESGYDAVSPAGGEPLRYVRPDGAVVWLRVTASEIAGAHDLSVEMVEDVTTHRRAELELRETSALLERAQEVARVGSFVVDMAEGRLHWSPALARLLGTTEDVEIRSSSDFRERFVHEGDLDAWAAAMDRAYREGGPFTIEARMRRANGAVIRGEMHGIVELDENGEATRLLGVLRDVTDERGLEEQLRQAQKLDAVGQLAGGIAHDFNNLLTVIAGNAMLGLAAGGTRSLDEELGEILRASEAASELIRRLLAFSRADTAERRVVDLNEAVQAVRRMLARVLEERIDVEAELAPVAATIRADPVELEQVLLNLGVNARDAMPEGGRLAIETHVDASTVTLRVSDDGVGMDESVRDRIFDPFFTTKPRDKGTGLGLSTVYGILKKEDATIDVDSAPGAGTTFTIRWPRAEAVGQDDVVHEPGPVAPGAGERVLLVEDEPMVRAIAAEILGNAGYEVVTAENGEEALRLVDEGERFDAVVSDLMMPKLTGFQLTEELRARGYRLPTVYTSGYAEGVGPHGPDDPLVTFVGKPFGAAVLAAAVRGQLDRAGRAAKPS